MSGSEDFDGHALGEELFDSVMIVDVRGLRFTRSPIPGHSHSKGASSLANVFDVAVTHEGIQDVFLGSVTGDLKPEPVVLQQSVTSFLKANLE